MVQNIYQIALVAHIVGITIMAGTTFIDFIAFKHFWKIFSADKAKSLVFEDNLYKLQRFIGIGMLVIIISGVLMMVYMHQVWGQQTWFRVKMGILVLIIINGLVIRRRMGSKLKKLLAKQSLEMSFNARLSGFRRNITTVHIFQMLFFIIIFVLSVFKFN
ncbi:MAG TPA: hypothetical protein VGQ09_12075 [Chitinophagaceae bacterium]|jgi:uncharacterized membrane protein|nr:hypothetical protein [Chitinophagaceae bacterium]